MVRNTAQTNEQPGQPLSEGELWRRRKAVDFARVSCEMEGLYCTDETYIELTERYARGEIDAGEIDRYVDALLEEAVNAQRKEETNEPQFA